MTSLIANCSEKEAHDALNKIADDRKSHEDLCIGLLVSILSDPSNATRVRKMKNKIIKILFNKYLF